MRQKDNSVLGRYCIAARSPCVSCIVRDDGLPLKPSLCARRVSQVILKSDAVPLLPCTAGLQLGMGEALIEAGTQSACKLQEIEEARKDPDQPAYTAESKSQHARKENRSAPQLLSCW